MRNLLVIILMFLLIASCNSDTKESNPTLSDEKVKAGKELIEELIKLSEGGIGDTVLLAKIERFGAVLALTSNELIVLKKRGLSDRVIKKLVTGFNK